MVLQKHTWPSELLCSLKVEFNVKKKAINYCNSLKPGCRKDSETQSVPNPRSPFHSLRVSRYCDTCRMVQCSCYLAQSTSISPQEPRSPAPHKQPFASSIFSSLSSSGLQRARRLGPPLAHRAPSTSPRGGGGSNRDVSPPACPAQPLGLILGWSPPINLCLKHIQRQVHTGGGGAS